MIKRTALVPRGVYERDARIFVVATEGKVTERNYLSLFRNSRLHIEVLTAGDDDRSAPQHVLDRLAKSEEAYQLTHGDERWLMLDVDRWPKGRLASVLQMASESGYRLAVSNPCFEVWIVLHHADYDLADKSCGTAKTRLDTLVGGYNHSNATFRATTRFPVEQAIVRAKALDSDGATRSPQFPGTHVYKLVEILMQYQSGIAHPDSPIQSASATT